MSLGCLLGAKSPHQESVGSPISAKVGMSCAAEEPSCRSSGGRPSQTLLAAQITTHCTLHESVVNLARQCPSLYFVISGIGPSRICHRNIDRRYLNQSGRYHTSHDRATSRSRAALPGLRVPARNWARHERERTVATSGQPRPFPPECGGGLAQAACRESAAAGRGASKNLALPLGRGANPPPVRRAVHLSRCRSP
jgi:hypothetical protein